MNHSEAVEQMVAERYLLDELTPDFREAFEEHVFECQDCALDLRVGTFFVDEAKLQLPGLTVAARELPADSAATDRKKWYSWFSPAFAMPAFALLLIVLGYQNIVTIPGLRSEASEPAVLPWTSVHVGTRAAAPTPVVADRTHGVMLLVDLPQQGTYASYSFALYDAENNRVWKSSVVTPAPNETGTVSLQVPGRGLRQGTYSLAVSGVLASGQTTEIGRRALDVSFGNP
ncbi:MAG: zf-HC2 domain-containing protein [Terracidiphilus sp.]